MHIIYADAPVSLFLLRYAVTWYKDFGRAKTNVYIASINRMLYRRFHSGSHPYVRLPYSTISVVD